MCVLDGDVCTWLLGDWAATVCLSVCPWSWAWLHSESTGTFLGDTERLSARLLSSCRFSSHADTVAQLIPDADSPLHERVTQYRQLLDGLPMDAYTHGCILHPELTTDSMIPKYATAEIRSKWSHRRLHCINMAGIYYQ